MFLPRSRLAAPWLTVFRKRAQNTVIQGAG